MINQILDIISKWHGVGQGIFFVIVLLLFLGTFNLIMEKLAVICRGWPPAKNADDEDE